MCTPEPRVSECMCMHISLRSLSTQHSRNGTCVYTAVRRETQAEEHAYMYRTRKLHTSAILSVAIFVATRSLTGGTMLVSDLRAGLLLALKESVVLLLVYEDCAIDDHEEPIR